MDGPSHLPLDGPRRFDFARDCFAFENQTYWEYNFEAGTGKTTFSPRQPRPDYAHRCFVLTKAARQFLYHARFDNSLKAGGDDACRRLIRAVVLRPPRARSRPEDLIVIPGYSDLREFSAAREALLKAGCGGAWRSYVLRSHWRMVFPISRAHQARTAASLVASIKQNVPPIIHLVRFPVVTINHSMMVFDAAETGGGFVFQAYDPNDPARPAELSFDHATSTFTLPRNRYWAGGPLQIIEVYRNWWM